jgi:hypothetical protein
VIVVAKTTKPNPSGKTPAQHHYPMDSYKSASIISRALFRSAPGSAKPRSPFAIRFTPSPLDSPAVRHQMLRSNSAAAEPPSPLAFRFTPSPLDSPAVRRQIDIEVRRYIDQKMAEAIRRSGSRHFIIRL